ncbi:DUF2752 domain-containing protein [Skermania sp. ID1734]|uniref:DUF2752 domain-containing protein n=1 Tax=Skermania sp. ID1734 TaxID=2597516 RepID=UPI00351AB72C
MLAPVGVLAGVAALCLFVNWADPATPGGPVPICPTKALLGIDCPGCGSMRMVYALCHGDVTGAVRYNALGLVAFIALAATFVQWTIGLMSGRSTRYWHQTDLAPKITLIAVIVWFVVRNIPWGPFRELRV